MAEPIWNQPEFFCWTVKFWVEEEETEVMMRGWAGGPGSHFFSGGDRANSLPAGLFEGLSGRLAAFDPRIGVGVLEGFIAHHSENFLYQRGSSACTFEGPLGDVWSCVDWGLPSPTN